MMLSYLGIEMLPKDIIAKRSDNTCMKRDWGEAKWESDQSGLTFAKALDNYLNGGGLYSPAYDPAGGLTASPNQSSTM